MPGPRGDPDRGASGGYSPFVTDGKLRCSHNYGGRAVYGLESDVVLAPGQRTLRFEFEPTGQPDLEHGKGAPGKLQLYVDGTLTGNAEAPVTTPFKFTGTIHSVTVDVSGELIEDSEAELRVHMARQ